MSLELRAVPHDAAENLRESIEPLVRKAIARGQRLQPAVDDVFRRLRDKESQLWVVTNAGNVRAIVVLSVIDSTADVRVFVEILAGTGLNDWASLVEDALRRFQASIGASAIEAPCRPGLAKVLRGRGWRRSAIVMELK